MTSERSDPKTLALATEFLDLRRRFEVGEYTDVRATASRAIESLRSAAPNGGPLVADLLPLFQELAGVAALETGHPEEALELVDAAVAYWKQRHTAEPLARGLINRALVLERLGKLAQAQDDYLEAELILRIASVAGPRLSVHHE